MRRKFLRLMTLCSFACLVLCGACIGAMGFGGGSKKATALAAEPDKIIKTELEFKNIDFAEAETKNKVIYVASPFGDSLSSNQLKLDKGAKLTYSYYTPTPLAGMGGLDIQYYSVSNLGITTYLNLAAPLKMENITDSEGASAFYPDDITTKLGNGWYTRTITFPQEIFKDAVEVRIQHIFLAGAVKTSDLKAMKDAGKTSLVMYYKNFSLTNFEGEKNIFNDTSGGTPFKNWDGLGYNDSSIPGLPFAGSTYHYVVGSKLTLSLGVDPKPLKIVLDTAERVFYAEREYDLMIYSKTSGTVISSVKKDGVAVPLIANGKYTLKEGDYEVIYTNNTASNTAKAIYKFTAYDYDTPIIMQSDMDKISKDGVAAKKTLLPIIKAYYHGEKTVSTVITVTDPSGKAMPVVANEVEVYFTTTAKKSGVYTVTYTATKGDVQFTLSRNMNVLDLDYPTASFSNWVSNLEVGASYVLPKVEITDPSDGKISDYNIKVLNTFGESIEIKEGAIRPLVSGGYKAVVTVSDSDKNEKTYEYAFAVTPITESVYTMRAYVPAEARAEGFQKKLVLSLSKDMFRTVPVLLGDVLHYEVYSPKPLKGMGSFSGQFEGSFLSKQWPIISDFYGEFDTRDTNGNSMVTSTDLSGKMKDITGAPIWLTREVELAKDGTSKFVGGKFAHFAIVLDTTAACGEYIDVSYRNAYIRRGSGEIIPIIPSPRTIDFNVWEKKNVSSGYLVGGLDPEPVLLQQFLPQNSELGVPVMISKNVVYDFNINKLLPSTLEVFDSDGAKVEISTDDFGYVLNAQKADTYTLTYSFTSAGIKKKLSTTLTLEDSTPPGIKFGEYKSDYKVGETINLPTPQLSDLVTGADKLKVKITAFHNSKAINLADNKIENAQEGQYMVVFSCTDESGNPSVERIYFNVTAEEKSGCGAVSLGDISDVAGGGSSLAGGIAVILAIFITLLFILKRGKRREGTCKRA